MKISGKQVAAARELLGITQTELGQSAGLALKTISNFEAGHAEPYPVNLEKIRAELERRGIEFTNGDSLGLTRFCGQVGYVDEGAWLLLERARDWRSNCIGLT